MIICQAARLVRSTVSDPDLFLPMPGWPRIQGYCFFTSVSLEEAAGTELLARLV